MEKENRWVMEKPQTLYQTIDKWNQVDCDFSCSLPEYSENIKQQMEAYSDMLGQYLQQLQNEIEKPFLPGGDYE